MHRHLVRQGEEGQGDGQGGEVEHEPVEGGVDLALHLLAQGLGFPFELLPQGVHAVLHPRHLGGEGGHGSTMPCSL